MFGLDFKIGSLATLKHRPGFDPTVLTSLSAWYDPGDLATLFQDAAMTVPVSADGDPVGAVLDKNGNGNHLTQSSSSYLLVFRSDGTRNWIETDGSGDVLLGGATHGDERFISIAMRYLGTGTVIYGGRSNSELRSYIAIADGTKLAAGIGLDNTAVTQVSGSIVNQDVVASLGYSTTTVTMRKNAIVGYFSARNGTAVPGTTADLGALNNAGLPYLNSAFRFYGLIETAAIPDQDQVGAIEALLADRAGVLL